jgi:hypothetical protein
MIEPKSCWRGALGRRTPSGDLRRWTFGANGSSRFGKREIIRLGENLREKLFSACGDSMDGRLLETRGAKNVRLVPVEPKVKSSKTFKMSNAGVSEIARNGKSADPTCYHSPVAQKSDPAVDAAGLFENLIRRMKVLHTPYYDVRTRAFCGPTAISAVTGLPISQIRDAIRSAGGKKLTADGRAHPIMGVSNADLLAAMEALGWRVVDKMQGVDYRLPAKERMKPYRLREFFDYAQMHEGPFIVNVTGHYIAVSEGEVCDTYTKLPIPLVRWKRGLNRHVKHWWKFDN